MGKRGPKPKPSALRVFEGNAGQHAIRPEVKPGGSATMPAGLKKVGKAVWAELAEVLGPLNMLTKADARMAFLYCQAWDEFTDATRTIARKGYYSVNQAGAPCLSAATKLRHLAIERIRRLSAEFGLSPASRVGLSVSSGPASDKMDKYRSG